MHHQCVNKISSDISRCDLGWGGTACSDPENLPTSLSDDFSADPSRTEWLSVVGGALSLKCGVLVAGTSLHFTGVRVIPGCPRTFEKLK